MRQILIALLNYFRTYRKEEKKVEEPGPMSAAKQFNIKRLTEVTYGLKPYHKPQNKTSVQPSETSVQSSEKLRQIDKNVLKCLNQVIQEPVVHLEKQNILLSVGTIMIKLTTGGK